ncbi:hypothetical protein, conserved [Trypanosoma brucei brucei TREU927]|uniref:Zinc finger PHD-type domain-containing protein n=1 Tax=Trypanosoma brucei brucei (strain 927/4 GUTat10.1) TaxID=185431 RepID=Q389Y3_TRYB2|nr:hypothetical protein, conserved [Trypanosoma brucei brucei TREU927]EAN78387.1 hypothetical protein, conserved [Trypanosoma brucei brucei TREU927]
MRIVIDVDAVLPIRYADDENNVDSNCKPFNIIEDNSQSDNDEESITKRGTEKKPAAPVVRKRSRPPSSHSSSALYSALQPRKNWAKNMFRGDTPYSLLKREDLFERCNYIMDHDDFVWCSENNVPHTLFADAVTQLERRYATCLLETVKNRTAAGGASSEENVSNWSEQTMGLGDGRGYGLAGGIACGVCSQKERSERAGDRFLRCRRCGVQAHLSCWYLNQLPLDVEDWSCPACHVARREKGLGHCCVCRRKGGVMLPYMSGVEWRRYEQLASHEIPKEDSPAAAFCHVVCALAFSELLIDEQRRVVHPAKRAKRVGVIALCVFCRSNSGEGLTMCHHKRCFTSMHPACAQIAGTIECYRAESVPAGSAWGGCNVYCSDHFREALSVAAHSEVTSVNAESAALKHVTPSGLVTLENDNHVEGSNLAGVVSNSAVAPSLDAVKLRWVEKRAQRLRESAQMVEEIRKGKRDILSVLFRPEVVKVSATEVQLSRFVFLIPELQQHINSAVEGILPVVDDEYEDVQRYRKVQSRTRHAGNTVQLYQKMQQVVSHVDVFCELSNVIRKRAALRREWVETELKILHQRCGIADDN